MISLQHHCSITYQIADVTLNLMLANLEGALSSDTQQLN